MRSVVHPGPVRTSRMDLVPCQGRTIEVTLAAGCPLEEAVENALAPLHIDSAWLEISDADVSLFNYVIPAEAADNRHVAWYSDTRGFAKGKIDHLGMIVGVSERVSFLHGHGLWTETGGVQAMGHILAKQTTLASPVTATGIGLVGACFNRRTDPETCFDLFHADPVAHNDSHSANQNVAALRLLPNQDLAAGIDAACHALGWVAARVHGLGSINNARFRDGQVLNSLPTEFLITDAIALGEKNSAVRALNEGPEIAIVGVDGDTILQGRLSRDDNPVLVTAELVLWKLNV